MRRAALLGKVPARLAAARGGLQRYEPLRGHTSASRRCLARRSLSACDAGDHHRSRRIGGPRGTEAYRRSRSDARLLIRLGPRGQVTPHLARCRRLGRWTDEAAWRTVPASNARCTLAQRCPAPAARCSRRPPLTTHFSTHGRSGSLGRWQRRGSDPCRERVGSHALRKSGPWCVGKPAHRQKRRQGGRHPTSRRRATTAAGTPHHSGKP